MNKILGSLFVGLLSLTVLNAEVVVEKNSQHMFDKEVSNENLSIEDLKENKVDEIKKEKIEEAKERAINKITERVDILEKAKQCIKESNNKDDLENCRPNKKEKKIEE